MYDLLKYFPQRQKRGVMRLPKNTPPKAESRGRDIYHAHILLRALAKCSHVGWNTALLKMNPEDRVLFDRWITAPLSVLRGLPNGDGAFVALSIGFGLYERFLASTLHKAGGLADDNARYRLAAMDFGGQVSAEDFKKFWDMYRVGMQHYFHPKHFTKSSDGTNWGWEISEHENYHAYPVIEQRAEKTFVIVINPWAFVDHVLRRWHENGDLLNELSATELGAIRTSFPVHSPEPRSYYTYSKASPQSTE